MKFFRLAYKFGVKEKNNESGSGPMSGDVNGSLIFLWFPFSFVHRRAMQIYFSISIIELFRKFI